MGKSEVRREEIQNNLLLVEGENDQHVVWSLLEHYKVPERFEVMDKKGIENLLEHLRVNLSGLWWERWE